MVSGEVIDHTSLIIWTDSFYKPLEYTLLVDIFSKLGSLRLRAEPVSRPGMRVYSLADLVVVEILWPAVVDEYRHCRGYNVEVVIVVARDGEVPHPAAMVDRGGAPVGDCEQCRWRSGGAHPSIVCSQEPSSDDKGPRTSGRRWCG